MAADRGQDPARIAAGERLRDAMHWSRGRAELIEQGLITADPVRIEFERIALIDEPSFVSIAEPLQESHV